jgi:hypothetical protein
MAASAQRDNVSAQSCGKLEASPIAAGNRTRCAGFAPAQLAAPASHPRLQKNNNSDQRQGLWAP